MDTLTSVRRENVVTLAINEESASGFFFSSFSFPLCAEIYYGMEWAGMRWGGVDGMCVGRGVPYHNHTT